ncbi:NADH-quinone oxidoreductase subunit M, partial [Klebsiella pneumoniae]|nr:NADH-quinone oxidoreductase subunit M [Klebsiella pneumoniae]
GTFDVFPVVAAIAVVGIVLTAALFLLALQRAFMGETPEPLRALPDLHWREILAVAPLVALFVVLGLYPRLALDLIDAASWL